MRSQIGPTEATSEKNCRRSIAIIEPSFPGVISKRIDFQVTFPSKKRRRAIKDNCRCFQLVDHLRTEQSEMMLAIMRCQTFNGVRDKKETKQDEAKQMCKDNRKDENDTHARLENIIL
uniref:Uncharacterized protein n=1 Tax=Romanomermis culicivorax TaxID=13658 RepID=A0A915IPX3_ROMCU